MYSFKYLGPPDEYMWVENEEHCGWQMLSRHTANLLNYLNSNGIPRERKPERRCLYIEVIYSPDHFGGHTWSYDSGIRAFACRWFYSCTNPGRFGNDYAHTYDFGWHF